MFDYFWMAILVNCCQVLGSDPIVLTLFTRAIHIAFGTIYKGFQLKMLNFVIYSMYLNSLKTWILISESFVYEFELHV
jgi:hypothetical protein